MAQLYGTYRCHYPAGHQPGPQAVRVPSLHAGLTGAQLLVAIPVWTVLLSVATGLSWVGCGLFVLLVAALITRPSSAQAR